MILLNMSFIDICCSSSKTVAARKVYISATCVKSCLLNTNPDKLDKYFSIAQLENI